MSHTYICPPTRWASLCANSYLHFNNKTTDLRNCQPSVIDFNVVEAVGTLVIGAPRNMLTLPLISAVYFSYFIFRFVVWKNHATAVWQPFAGRDAFVFWFMFFCFVLFITREHRQRQRFLKHKTFLAKLQRTSSARDTVAVLMSNILPAAVLNRLIRNESVVDFRLATVLYSDVVSFTAWSANRNALEVVQMLNQLYKDVDRDLRIFGVEKVSTIGDAYWAVCGIPQVQELHAHRMCAFGLQIQRHAANLRRQKLLIDVHLRVGINSGDVCGGIVGQRQFAYQIFGHASNVAEDMEKLAPVNGVLISCDTMTILQQTEFFLDREVPEGCDGDSGRRLQVAPGPVDGTYVLLEAPWAPPSSTQSDGRGSQRGSARTVDLTSARRALRMQQKMQQRQYLMERAPSSSNQLRSADDNAAPRTDVVAMPDVNFDEKRLLLSERKYAHVFHTFRDPAAEEAFQGYAKDAFAATASVMCLVMMTWFVVCLVIFASDATRAPTGGFVIYVALFIVAALNVWFKDRVHAYVTCARMSVEFWVQLIFLTTVPYPMLLNIDMVYLSDFVGFAFIATGVPGLPWSLGVVWASLTLRGALTITYVVNGANVANSIVAWFAWVVVLILGLRRNEVEVRSQFLDDHVASVADGDFAAERSELESLLSRSLPAFVLPELVEWLSNGRFGIISHHHADVVVLFVSVPQVIAATMDTTTLSTMKRGPLLDVHSAATDPTTHPHSELLSALDVFAPVTRLVQTYEEVLQNDPFVNHCVKIKTIGDVMLVVTGMRKNVSSRTVSQNDLKVASTETTDASQRSRPRSGVAADIARTALLAKTIENAVFENHGITGVVASGIHCGHVIAGVLGEERLIYDVFGDTVNTASRVMSSSLLMVSKGDRGVMRGEIWMTRATASVIVNADTAMAAAVAVAVDSDGFVDLTFGALETRHAKGKGDMDVVRVANVSRQLLAGGGKPSLGTQ